MRFDIITIFPEIFNFYCQHSLLQKAQQKGVIEINALDLRNFTKDEHRTVDDKPFGGGRGMVLKVEPIYRAIQSLKTRQNRKIILFSPRGKKFNQKMATKWSELDQLVFICGRYEAVDERVAEHIADQVISIGDYVLMSGDLAGLVVLETVARLQPGVIGKSDILQQKRVTNKGGFREYPQYTRPEVFESQPDIKWSVPKVLLSGHHKKIEQWRKDHTRVIE